VRSSAISRLFTLEVGRHALTPNGARTNSRVLRGKLVRSVLFDH